VNKNSLTKPQRPGQDYRAFGAKKRKKKTPKSYSKKKKVKKSGTSSLQTTSGVNVATGSGLNIS
jgi:hypothetical protein